MNINNKRGAEVARSGSKKFLYLKIMNFHLHTWSKMAFSTCLLQVQPLMTHNLLSCFGMKINLDLYFRTSLWCLKDLLKAPQKSENKRLT